MRKKMKKRKVAKPIKAWAIIGYDGEIYSVRMAKIALPSLIDIRDRIGRVIIRELPRKKIK